MSPETQALLRQAAEVDAEATAALAASLARPIPEIDPMAGWVPTRPPEPELVRRAMAAPEQRRAPAAVARKPRPVTRKTLDAWALYLVRTVGEAVGKHLREIRRENRELAQLVEQLARRVAELEDRR